MTEVVIAASSAGGIATLTTACAGVALQHAAEVRLHVVYILVLRSRKVCVVVGPLVGEHDGVKVLKDGIGLFHLE